jgi:hypothetical protein
MNHEAVSHGRPAILEQTGLISTDAGLQPTATRSNDSSFLVVGQAS